MKKIPSFNIVRLRVRCSAECLIFFKYPGSASAEAKKADQVDPWVQLKFGPHGSTRAAAGGKLFLETSNFDSW